MLCIDLHLGHISFAVRVQQRPHTSSRTHGGLPSGPLVFPAQHTSRRAVRRAQQRGPRAAPHALVPSASTGRRSSSLSRRYQAASIPRGDYDRHTAARAACSLRGSARPTARLGLPSRGPCATCGVCVSRCPAGPARPSGAHAFGAWWHPAAHVCELRGRDGVLVAAANGVRRVLCAPRVGGYCRRWREHATVSVPDTRHGGGRAARDRLNDRGAVKMDIFRQRTVLHIGTGRALVVSQAGHIAARRGAATPTSKSWPARCGERRDEGEGEPRSPSSMALLARRARLSNVVVATRQQRRRCALKPGYIVAAARHGDEHGLVRPTQSAIPEIAPTAATGKTRTLRPGPRPSRCVHALGDHTDREMMAPQRCVLYGTGTIVLVHLGTAQASERGRGSVRRGNEFADAWGREGGHGNEGGCTYVGPCVRVGSERGWACRRAETVWRRGLPESEDV